MDDLFKDKRFSHVGSDARFKNLSRKDKKIKIDKRFQSVFTDKKFQLKYAVDIRGRPVQETQADNYKKYYDIASDSDSDESSGSENENENSETENNVSADNDDVSVSDNDVDEEDVVSDVSNLDSDLKTKRIADKEKNSNTKLTKALDEEHKTKINDVVHGRLQDMSIDYARGIGTIASDSSSDDDSSDESDTIFVEHPWGELDKDAETTDEATRRLAVCYLDWDRIYAKDVMVLLHSFLPADGIIESVTIYPSEYGLERMKEEEVKGPKELVDIAETQDLEDDNNEDDAEGKAYHLEKLREYQLNRLKYYYAVVVCNNAETANKLYSECNGMEYESCAAKLDMRFIPDDMTFDQEPREVCTSLPDITKYKPRLFENTALRHGKVALTWDETDPRRIEFNKRLASGDNINDDDLNNYIACSSEEEGVSDKEEVDSDSKEIEEVESSEEESQPKDKLSKYRSLIAAIKNDEEKRKNKDVEMEISWGAGVKSEKDDREKRPNKNEKSNDADLKSFNRSENSSSEDEFNSDPLISSEDEEAYTSLKKEKSKKKQKTKKTNIDNSSDEEKKHAELDLLLIEDNPDVIQKQHFSLKGIQKQEKEGKAKKKKWRKELKQKINANKEEDNFKVDVTDKRFSALYTSHLFNIDPAHPQFKKTKAMDEFINEKQKRRKLEDNKEVSSSFKEQPKKKLNTELSSLVNSIKGKTALKRK